MAGVVDLLLTGDEGLGGVGAGGCVMEELHEL